MADREKVLNDLQELCEHLFHEYKVCYKGDEEDTYNRFLIANNALNLLKEQEAIVRCKDCKYAYLTSDGECKYCELEKDDNGSLIEMYRSWDWFCADGERRDDDA